MLRTAYKIWIVMNLCLVDDLVDVDVDVDVDVNVNQTWIVPPFGLAS